MPLPASPLTDDGGGDVHNDAGSLRGAAMVGDEKQLEGEAFLQGHVLHHHAILVTTVGAAHCHLLSIHQLHQLLCLAGAALAGAAETAWLVSGREVEESVFKTGLPCFNISQDAFLPVPTEAVLLKGTPLYHQV